MSSIPLRVSLVLLSLITITSACFPSDYIRLKNGQVIVCRILSQDSSVVYTNVENPAERSKQGSLQVYSRDEIESIWFQKPVDDRKISYTPHAKGYEFGGGFAYQAWAENQTTFNPEYDIVYYHRKLLSFIIHGGYTIHPYISLELDGDVSIPIGEKSDSVWHNLKVGYQGTANVVLHPWVYKGFTPIFFLGAGTSIGIPSNQTILTYSKDARNLMDAGIGVKWGSNGLGYRLEWRHNYYAWTPSVKINGHDAPEYSAHSTEFRATVFIYR